MALQAFTWGSGGEKLTPSQAAQRRKMADALLGPRPAATTFGGGLAEIGNALRGIHAQGQADAADAAHSSQRKAIMDALVANPDPGMADILGALSNDVVTADPNSSAVLQALLGAEMQQNDPLRQLQIQKGQLELDALRNPPPPAPDYGFIELPDGSIIRTDATSGGVESMGQFGTPPAPAPTDDMREYEMAKGQGFTGTLQDWIAAKPTAGGVTVNTGDNSGAFMKKADETAATRMSDLVTAGQGASQFMGDIQALAALGAQIDTGKGAEVLATLGPYAQALGVEMNGLSEAQAYQAIIDRMAPAMRPAGSGAASDFDARQFLSSLPSLGRTPEGNQIIMQTLSALQQHKIAAAEIASKALSGQTTWQEADKEIAALGDPFTAFNEYGKQQTNAEPGSIDPKYEAAEPPPGWGGDPALWRFMPPEDRALW